MSRWLHALLGTAVTVVWLLRAFTVIGSAAPAPPASSGWHIPDSAAADRSPLTVSSGDLARGQSLFRAKCQNCHGANGNGHGPDSDPNHPAGDLTDGHAGLRNPDGVLFFKADGQKRGKIGIPRPRAKPSQFAGSYDPVLWGVIPAFLIAAVAVATTGPYPDLEAGEDAEPRS